MDYTIEQMENNMTIIFNKRTGNIKGAFTGIQHIDILYGDEAEDYKLIWSELITTRDEYVLNNIRQFKVNPETKVIEILSSLVANYPIAAQ